MQHARVLESLPFHVESITIKAGPGQVPSVEQGKSLELPSEPTRPSMRNDYGGDNQALRATFRGDEETQAVGKLDSLNCGSLIVDDKSTQAEMGLDIRFPNFLPFHSPCAEEAAVQTKLHAKGREDSLVPMLRGLLAQFTGELEPVRRGDSAAVGDSVQAATSFHTCSQRNIQYHERGRLISEGRAVEFRHAGVVRLSEEEMEMMSICGRHLLYMDALHVMIELCAAILPSLPMDRLQGKHYASKLVAIAREAGGV